MVQKKLVKGVIVPIVTPYHLDDIFGLVDHIVEGGISQIALIGTTGEAPKLNLKQKKEILKKVGPYIVKKANLIVGISMPSWKDSTELMQMGFDM